MKISEELSKPYNIISLIITILSIILSIIFFVKSQKEMLPTYLNNKTSYKIFDSNASSPNIVLSDKNGNKIEDDVYLAETVFWNAGDLPIEPENVRTPIKIVIKPCKKILEFKILDVTKPEISEISVYKDSIKENELVLNWAHLDPDFGVKIQVIYVGSQNSQVDFQGYIVGVDEISKVPSKDEKEGIRTIFEVIIGMIIGASSIILMIVIISLIRPSKVKVQYKNSNLFVLIMLLIIAILIRYLFLSVPSPPF